MCLGVVGPTGSGKTTLSSLIVRFFDPTEGAITLDGVDLREYKIADLRSQFGVVLQDTLLFSTTIAENIRFAMPEATMGEIVEAAELADAHDFIESLPEGYNTQVGERGMKLSGGERQRISLARAFLKDAPVLILDEPTSSLDVHTEATILAALQRLMNGRTTLMIAHRPSTLRACNSILVLEPGGKSRMTDEVASHIQGLAAVGGESWRTTLVGGGARLSGRAATPAHVDARLLRRPPRRDGGRPVARHRVPERRHSDQPLPRPERDRARGAMDREVPRDEQTP